MRYLAGAVYGDGSHFIFRYIRNRRVYEADGMTTLKDHRRIKAALSREISEPHEISLAGHINWTTNTKKKRVGGKKIVDVYDILKIGFNDTVGCFHGNINLQVPGYTSPGTRVQRDEIGIGILRS